MKYLSLFSGIGGFELGLENADKEFECIGFSEIDKYAKSIYLGHFPRHTDLGDATEIDPKEIEDFELLVGGFPCQAFSLSGKRLGFDDTRGTMFFEIARILKSKKPRYFLLENVKGLLSHDGGRTYKKILGVLSELGYDVEWEIYNSCDFGVPQNRERLYIKGYSRAECGREILSQKRNRTKTDVRLKPIKFNRQVRKRVHTTDYMELCAFLRSHKRAANASLAFISEELGVKKSEVAHWFRTDDYFAPPPSEVWDDLKKILNIADDKYDAFITEWVYEDGVFEMDKRAYHEDGLSSTLTCNGESLVGVNVIGNTSPTNHWRSNVYDPNGIAPSMTACDYKSSRQVIERKREEPRINKVGNVNPSGGSQSGDVYGDNGLCCTLTATDSQHPVKILEGAENNKDIKRVHDTNGISPTLVSQSLHKNGIRIRTNTTKGYDEVDSGDGIRLCHPTSTTARGRTEKEQTGALSTGPDWGTVERDYRIRRLTPRECERLQAFPDDWTLYGKDGEKISDTQRYKCIGNAVTTTVVTYIANTMFGGSFDSERTD